MQETARKLERHVEELDRLRRDTSVMKAEA
jgi:hypothetical protein